MVLLFFSKPRNLKSSLMKCGRNGQTVRKRRNIPIMGEKDNIEVTAAASDDSDAGAAAPGAMDIAAQGAASALSAGLVIVLGAAAGGLLSFLGYKLYYHLTKPKS
jgi:hypothetical protein